MLQKRKENSQFQGKKVLNPLMRNDSLSNHVK